MTLVIEHLVEPQRLLLYWQAGENEVCGCFRVGQLIKKGHDVILRYETGAELTQAENIGFRGYPAFTLKNSVHSHQVLEAFIRRLPPRSRRDFARYLELRAISPDSQLSDFALLGYTGGKLPDDGFELFHPFDNPPESFELLVEIAGFRHGSEIGVEQLTEGKLVQFVPEPENQFDPQAIRLESGSHALGYVPKGHLEMLHRMFSEGANVVGEIFRINGTAERPLVYVLTRVTRNLGPAMPFDSVRMQA